MFKNWEAICACENTGLRMLLATADDPKILRRLERGFPEFFTPEEHKDPRVPLSAIREQIRHRDTESEAMTDIIDKFEIPLFWFGDNDGDIGEIPKEWEQYNRTYLGDEPPVVVQYQGEPCIVVECSDTYIAIAPAKFFDLEK